MSFWIKEKLILRISGGKRKSFLTHFSPQKKKKKTKKQQQQKKTIGYFL